MERLIMDSGLLLARLVFGLLMAAHGTQKLFGWFGGYGLAGTGGFFEQLGFRPGRFFAAVAGSTELVAGLLLAFGLLGPLGPALIVSVMLVAAVTVHWQHGLWVSNNGVELTLLYAAAAVALALTGFGAYSVDAALGLTWSTEVAWIALAMGVLGGVGNLAIRKTSPEAAHV
jgi:putative oxidoreductase